MRLLIRSFATHKLAASQLAGKSLFGGSPDSGHFAVVPCAINTTDIRSCASETQELRSSLGIPTDRIVVGHVGRFIFAKNHELIVEIASIAHQRHYPMHFVLVGDGPDRPRIEAEIKQRKLSEIVTFLGSRRDINKLLCAAFDVFLFPSRFEGLGLALVEAQAAGLPCVVSDVLPEEATVIPHLVKRQSIDVKAENWCQSILEMAGQRLDPQLAANLVEQSPFGIPTCVNSLNKLYRAA